MLSTRFGAERHWCSDNHGPGPDAVKLALGDAMAYRFDDCLAALRASLLWAACCCSLRHGFFGFIDLGKIRPLLGNSLGVASPHPRFGRGRKIYGKALALGFGFA